MEIAHRKDINYVKEMMIASVNVVAIIAVFIGAIGMVIFSVNTGFFGTILIALIILVPFLNVVKWASGIFPANVYMIYYLFNNYRKLSFAGILFNILIAPLESWDYIFMRIDNPFKGIMEKMHEMDIKLPEDGQE